MKTRFLLIVGILFASSFTFSCSSDDDPIEEVKYPRVVWCYKGSMCRSTTVADAEEEAEIEKWCKGIGSTFAGPKKPSTCDGS